MLRALAMLLLSKRITKVSSSYGLHPSTSDYEITDVDPKSQRIYPLTDSGSTGKATEKLSRVLHYEQT